MNAHTVTSALKMPPACPSWVPTAQAITATWCTHGLPLSEANFSCYADHRWPTGRWCDKAWAFGVMMEEIALATPGMVRARRPAPVRFPIWLVTPRAAHIKRIRMVFDDALACRADGRAERLAGFNGPFQNVLFLQAKIAQPEIRSQKHWKKGCCAFSCCASDHFTTLEKPANLKNTPQGYRKWAFPAASGQDLLTFSRFSGIKIGILFNNETQAAHILPFFGPAQ